MNFYTLDNIVDFYDVSIILPFYKKFDEFQKVLPVNLGFFQRNGIELIIVLDTPEEEDELINFLGNFPFLNIQVVINRNYHDWRNPSKAINVGIKHANMKYVFIASPETEFLTDVIYQLRYVLQYQSKAFAIGQVTFIDFDTSVRLEDIHQHKLMPYGSIMVEKSFLEEVNGYSEHFIDWGGDDDNIRARLELLGLRKIFVSQAIAIHRELKVNGQRGKVNRHWPISFDAYKNIFYPQRVRVNDEKWGFDFNEKIYCWRSRSNTMEQCKNYLQKFKESWIKDDSIFNEHFKLIALIQVKNEISHIPSVLDHLDKYCDGIILLDDGSTDGSYEAAMSEKLLLKVKKEPVEIFDDLLLRNITLDLAAFFNVDWLFFFDADERFDTRYADLYSITQCPYIDSVCFHLVHLWNNENFYKVNLPEKEDGILLRFRMFRSIGRLQINSNRLLHFPATPYKRNRVDAHILIRHHGNIAASTRRIKYERYIKQDKEGLTQGYTYEYLIEESSTLRDVNSLVL